MLVVTSAEEFLTSRKASFSTGWQAEHAEAFWEEAIARLRKDLRFRDQLDGFKGKRPFFVDSKEGFRVDELRDALLPIVTDESHRARIREAQGRYVLETAREALGVLLGYIGTRSGNLNWLHDEAQKRADGTATAVEEILESLEFAFSSVSQGLQEACQAVSTSVFSVEAIVTSQTISQRHERTLGKVEGEVRGKLQAEVGESRNAAWRRLRRLCRACTRRWFRATGDVDVGMLLEPQFDVGGDGTGLSSAAKAVARATLRTVNQQLAASFASSIQHLRGRTEASEVGWSTGVGNNRKLLICDNRELRTSDWRRVCAGPPCWPGQQGRGSTGCHGMHGWETRMRLKHYLDQGVTKAELISQDLAITSGSAA